MRSRPRIGGMRVECPPPLAVDVVRRFPGHWLFDPAFLAGNTVMLSMPYADEGWFCWATIRVMWPDFWEFRDPYRHSWRCAFYHEHPYSLREFGSLDELPAAAASAIVAYANRGCGWSGQQRPGRAAAREILLSNQPPWLQVEIDRLTAPRPDRAKGLHL